MIIINVTYSQLMTQLIKMIKYKLKLLEVFSNIDIDFKFVYMIFFIYCHKIEVNI